MGIATNVGDALTFKILTENDQVLCRSVVRPADDKDHPNVQVHKPQGEEDLQEFKTKVDTIPIEQLVMPHLNPSDIVGQKFITDLEGDPFQAEVIEQQGEDKFLVQFRDGDHEKILTYNYVIDLINNRLDSGEDGYMAFEDIIDHRVNPKTRKYEVLVKWNLGTIDPNCKD